MSNPFNLKVGSIIHEMESNIDHRVIYENGDCFVTILMHSPKSKVIINEWYSEMIRNLLENREIVIHEPSQNLKTILKSYHSMKLWQKSWKKCRRYPYGRT